MNDDIRQHYERFPYPVYSLLARVRPADTYHLNRQSLWARFNGIWPDRPGAILLAGCGSFSPYPTRLANPDDTIIALDLSRTNLQRARRHALLHGCRNLSYLQGDILDGEVAPGPFHFIDCFGVLHHLAEPLAGLLALKRRLLPGGIIRLMVYSKSERQEAESIRRALRLLKIRDVASVRKLIARAGPDSRLAGFAAAAPELESDAGLADALLHPRATTFRVAALLELLAASGLTILQFAHPGALPDPAAEIERLQRVEQERGALPNFILYLGNGPSGAAPLGASSILRLNPLLDRAVSLLQLRGFTIPPRFGRVNPLLDLTNRNFLRRFRSPQQVASLTPAELQQAGPFLQAMFLVASSN